MLQYTTVCMPDVDEPMVGLSSRPVWPAVIDAPDRDQVSSALTTAAAVAPLASLTWTDLPQPVQHETVRHLVDTVGLMIAGSWTRAALGIADALGSTGGDGPVLGQAGRVSTLDAAFLGGVAAHGLEFDDGYREGSVHPGACVVPAALSLGYEHAVSGTDLLAAVAAGYEATAVIARAYHPAIRQRGFHPTGTAGVFGAAAAGGRLLGLDAAGLAGAFGTAASSAAGLFAFLSGGSDVKRLHAGSAARNGLFAALLAQRGVLGPPTVLEAPDGFAFAFAGNPTTSTAAAPAGEWAVADCYVKPYPCCRHLHTALDVIVSLLSEHAIEASEIESIEVDTYAVAAAHGRVGWGDPSRAQLSFPFVVATAARRRSVTLADFEPSRLNDPATAAIAARVGVRVDSELDRGYPAGRPARVTVTTSSGRVTETGYESRGARSHPLTDDELFAKFTDLVAPVLGPAGCDQLLGELVEIAGRSDIRSVVEHATRAAQDRPVRILW